MEPGPSPDPAAPSPLLALARESVVHGLAGGGPLPVDPAQWPETLARPGACFVTLRRHGQLRGCVGSLEARDPLVVDVAGNAWRAAFADGRFPRLREDELGELEIHVSVLGPLEPLVATSREALLEALRPGQDGLVLAEGARRATFLPAVWESLPESEAFLSQLLRKAGLDGDHWSSELEVWRYEVEELGE